MRTPQDEDQSNTIYIAVVTQTSKTRREKIKHARISCSFYYQR